MVWLAAGVVFQIVADAVVGVRLLLMAARTRRLPEACFGCCTLLLGGIGYPLAIAARRGLGGSAEADGWLLALALSIQNVGCLALWIVNWRVFRPGRAGTVLAAAGSIALIASIPGQALSIGFDGALSEGPFYWLGFAGRALPFAWSSFEAFRQWRLLERRSAFGLGSPVVSDRFRLWALFCSAVFLGFGVFAAAALTGTNPGEAPLVLAVTSTVGVGGGVSVWLTFLPPAAYLRRVEARAVGAPSPRPA